MHYSTLPPLLWNLCTFFSKSSHFVRIFCRRFLRPRRAVDEQVLPPRLLFQKHPCDDAGCGKERHCCHQLADTDAGREQIQAVGAKSFNPRSSQTVPRDVEQKHLAVELPFLAVEMQPDKAWAPNANSTIRLTYGKVGSYKPRDAVFYDYYTTLTGVIEKEGPKGGEFEVPDRLKELYAQQDFAPYGTDKLSVNFITDNDITGGNSGSGVINAEGHLIGTAFDGNSEAMSGDIDFEENLQRCINLDTRYFLWIVDKYAGAKNLINEMTIIK